MPTQLLSSVGFFVTAWTAACQAALSLGSSPARTLEWLPVPPPGDHPDPGIEPVSPALQADSSPLHHQGNAQL